ncbi:glycosyltransferase-like protein LARGE [Clonorchis sinensis]|uniref:Glycosyltransferase-like protein LARGE n=1 Tax=Clonorchis sinensis TaxID=79923 RepID=G7YPL5_CLOSI|nr:glycosyltransferase-like protein LARGE [Clonorchis sinensis]
MHSRLRQTLQYLLGFVGIFLVYSLLKRNWKLNLQSTPFAPEPAVLYLRWQDRNILEPIDVYTVVYGACAANQVVISLKSMLYFQGRYQNSSTACRIPMNRPSNIVCKHQPLEAYRPVRLHWVADIDARNRILSIFEEWQPTDVRIFLYEYERYLPYVASIPTRYFAGTPPLYKLLAPYILPEDVTKVIALDSDVLFNYNVLDLWKEFGQFKPGQAFGAVCEQITFCPYSCPKEDLPFPTFGINTGVLLMDLAELRRINWWQLWRQELLKEVNEWGYLPAGEQKVISQVMSKYNHLYHRLRCEWNIQIFRSDGMNCCPIHWVDRLPDETECISNPDHMRLREQARLIHYNIRRKPEPCGPYTPSPLEFQAGLKELSLQQLRHRYFQVYNKFRNMPTECLH